VRVSAGRHVRFVHSRSERQLGGDGSLHAEAGVSGVESVTRAWRSSGHPLRVSCGRRERYRRGLTATCTGNGAVEPGPCGG
jgi:hypothetical protein